MSQAKVHIMNALACHVPSLPAISMPYANENQVLQTQGGQLIQRDLLSDVYFSQITPLRLCKICKWYENPL